MSGLIFALGVLLMTADNAVGQDVSHLPPEKAAVVLELRGDRTMFYCVTKDIHQADRARFIENEMLGNINPILVGGRNVVFGKNTLANISKTSIRDFENLRNEIDFAYNALEDLVGAVA